MLPLTPSRSSFATPPSLWQLRAIATATVVLGVLTPLLPVIATAPVLPSFGFLMLIAWRLLRDDLWPVWVGLPLGLFNDLFSGQPLGSAMFGWTTALLGVDLAARRFIWRDHWQDWLIALPAIAWQIYAGLAIAWMTGGATPPWLMLPQLAIAALCFPACARMAGALDRWRFAA